MKLLLFISRLDHGGAERQVIETARGLSLLGHDVKVVTREPENALDYLLAESGIPSLSVEPSRLASTRSFPLRVWRLPQYFFRLLRIVRRVQPDAIVSYSTLPNFSSAVLKLLYPVGVVWSIRTIKGEPQSDAHPGISSRIVSLLEHKSARIPDRIIVNSQAGYDRLLQKHFPQARLRIVHNGIDTERFKPDQKLRNNVRSEFAVEPNIFLIGLVARRSFEKDHATFLRAAAMLLDDGRPVRFICVGGGRDRTYSTYLEELATELGISKSLIWTPSRNDVEAILNGIDVLVSSSTVEGFSNVIAEALSTGRPCVVTDVGDSALIVEEHGRVVPAQNAQLLANAIADVIDELQDFDSVAARRHVEENFSLRLLASKTQAVIQEVVPCP